MLKMAIPLALICLLAACASMEEDRSKSNNPRMETGTMELGNFSVSLTVKDIKKSRAFYEKLGFEQVGGVEAQNWLVLKNGTTKIGLFQGMFERNLLTFNPGWNDKAETLDSFLDVREIQARLLAAGVELTTTTDPDGTDIGHIAFVDPDGNPILIDQHVPKAKP